MVRPEGAHSELSQEADLTPPVARTALSGSADSAHYAVLKPAYCSLFRNAKVIEETKQGSE